MTAVGQHGLVSSLRLERQDFGGFDAPSQM